MKKKLMMILLLCATLVPVSAQEEKSQILIYKVDSTVDTLLLNNVRDIYHSRFDRTGTYHTDITTLRLRTLDGELVYPLEEIDHVVMPTSGRVISFMGTALNSDHSQNAKGSGPHKTSVDGTFPGTEGDAVVYKWVNGDYIFLSTGDRSNNVGISSNTATGHFTFRSDSLVADQYVVYYSGTNRTNETPFNQVTIPTEQTQTKPNNSDHLGQSGDCGTAVATRQPNSNYTFSIDHKTPVICFLPRVEAESGYLLNTLKLKSVAVKTRDGQKIAGTYTMTESDLTLIDATGQDTITLTTADFTLPHGREKAESWEHSPQDTVASYMVVAPQGVSTPMTVYYRIHDTKSELDTIVQKAVTFTQGLQGSKVYPVTSKIDPYVFLSAFTDSAKWEFGQEAKLFCSVNLPVAPVGIIWGYNKNLTFETMEEDIALTHDAELKFDATPVDDVKQKAYYYRAYAKRNGKDYLGKVKKFGMDREIINMGTSVRWSSINMGAVTAEDKGDHYAWGELQPKDTYSQDTYLYYHNGYQDIGSNIAGNPLYDVVTHNWRGCWRMPTKAELDELRSKCQWTWTDRVTEDGGTQHGLLVKNVNNDPDSVIFLPSAGYRNGGNLNVTDHCYYQSGSEFNQQYNRYQYDNRNNLDERAWKYEGLSIRPVFESNIETEDGKYLFVHTDSISYSADHTSTNMYGTTRGLDDVVTDITQGFVIGTTDNVELGSSDLEVTLTQTAADNGSYHLPLTKEQMNRLDFATTYYVRSYITYDDQTWYGDPLKMLAMTIVTDSTNWAVGKTEARLCGTVTGITESVVESTELGFVVGTTANVTLDTDGCIELPCDSTVNGKFVVDFPNIGFKQYYYRAFVRQGGRTAYGDPKMLGLEFVDLGLPSGLKWANINVGSQTPMDDGSPYSWGETTTKSSFNNNVDNRSYGTDIGGTTHDAAQVNWKGPWRLPSKSDVEELLANCTWEKITLYGKEGHMLTSKINHKSIFIPFTGYWYNGAQHYDYTWRFLLWTSTWSHDNRAWYFDNYPSNNPSPKMEHEDVHGYGFFVRPVALVNDTLQDNSMIQLTTDSVEWEVGQTTATLHGYLLGLRYNERATESGFAYATTPNVTNETAGVMYLKTNEGELYNVASGHFQADMPDIADNTVYYYRAYVKVDGQYYFANEREFGRRKVDLGLTSGTQWSNINLGASSSDDSGDYYAWGETTSKTRFDKPSVYADLGSDIAGSEHDAAHVNWSGLWRMPTQSDIQELLSECTWTEVTKYEQPMFKIVGPSGDSIFIAKRGSMSGTSVANDGSRASIWTSNLNTTEGSANENAYGTSFYGNTRNIDAVARYLGYTIRPVMKYNNMLSDGTEIFVSTESTNWEVGLTSVRLAGSVQSERSVEMTRGFVVGYSKDIEVGDANTTDVTAGSDFRGIVSYDKDTTYYYRAYVKVGDTYYYGKDAVGNSDARRYGLELVDMGNGILWASINLGAQTSSDYGYRYAWGETAAKTNFTESTYRHYDNGYVNIGANISNKASYDAVKATWTGTWRLPTNAEMAWLVENCDWTWTTEDGVAGYRVTSREENDKHTYNSIFLPAAGYQSASFYEQIERDCYYWTGALYNDGDAYLLHGSQTTSPGVEANHRYYGVSIRPVTTAGSEQGGGGDITGGHQQGGSQQTSYDGQGGGNAGTGNTGTTVGN